MKKTVWDDMREMIYEDMAIYSAIILINFFYDHIMIIIGHANQPIEYGIGQMMVFVLAGIQLIRKYIQLKYNP